MDVAAVLGYLPVEEATPDPSLLATAEERKAFRTIQVLGVEWNCLPPGPSDVCDAYVLPGCLTRMGVVDERFLRVGTQKVEGRAIERGCVGGTDLGYGAEILKGQLIGA